MASLAVDSRCRLGEAILWCDHRRVLYWTDILSAQLWRHDPATGDSRTWTLPEPLACLALSEDGRLLLGLANGLYASDLESQRHAGELALTGLADVESDEPHTRINDGRADRDGRFVFGTKSEHADRRRAGRFYQFSAVHGVRELALPMAAIPNSICFDGSGTRMYFCDSLDRRIMTCRYDSAQARVADIEVFVTMDDPRAEPDGSVIDADDAMWNAQWGIGRVVRYLADGSIDRIVALPADHPTCCTLSEDTLYVSTAREGLDSATLAAQPGSGGVFAYRNERAMARAVDRVALP